ncbi:MAG: hypothetical protein AB7I38_01570 [Dehalococcoidia bacterium]
MAHVHTEECERLHEALQSLRARQQPPRGAMGTFAGQLVNPERGLSPEGETPGVESEIADIRRALAAMECDR